ncbi:rod shape-determining protein MreC [Candidatus Uhrbacteria bacterium]|nr:rod shape-determining protein MreC [Candidatus Uhrbacteria bacterium]
MKLRPSISHRRPWLTGVFVFLVLLLFFLARGWVMNLLSPLLRAASSAGSALTVSLTSQEQRALEDQIVALSTDRADYERLKEENEVLRDELGFVERTGLSSVAASILSKSLSQTVARFVLDVGSDEGVQVGDPVVAQDGLLVGKIIQTEPGFSTALAMTDPTHTVGVSLLNDRRTIGVAYGTVGDLLEIRFIPADETIGVNDLVVTSGLDPTVPSGLLIGLVNAVQQDQATLFLTAVVEPLADVRRLSHVLVLTNTSL